MKYYHQFIVGFDGEPLGAGTLAIIKDNREVIPISDLVKKLNEISPETTGQTFIVNSHIVFLNK